MPEHEAAAMTEQHGKFGKGRHFKLVKKALIHTIDKYWETFGTIQVENKAIWMRASLSGMASTISRLDGDYKLHPDISVVIQQKHPDESIKFKKTIIVECETSLNGLLKDEMRLTAYKLLRMGTPDKNKLMMYIALPSELKGKANKPDYFNDLLFFNLKFSGGGKTVSKGEVE